MPTSDAEIRTRIRLLLAPITIILVSLPLLFDLVPPNGWYGIRVREAYASDEAWYAVNRVGGLAIVCAALIWLVAAAYAPSRYVPAIGVALMLGTLGLMTVIQGWTL